jgi:hypothetical protein
MVEPLLWQVVGAFSIQGVVVTGAGGAPVPRLLGEGRPEPPSPLDAVRNSSTNASDLDDCCHHIEKVSTSIQMFSIFITSLMITN